MSPQNESDAKNGQNHVRAESSFQFNAQNYAGTILSIWFSVRLWSSTVADCCIKTSPEGVENLDNSGTRV